MTISTTSSVATFLGNGVTNTFSFNFVGVASSDISVIYTNTSGISTVLSPSQYTLFLNAPSPGQLWGVGGNVVYPTSGSPIPNGTSLTILRTLPLVQETSITNQGNMWPTVIEQALDTLCMEIQQVSGRTGRILGVWTTATSYSYGDVVQDGVNGANTQNYYMCVQANTSGTWATDLANGLWSLAINVQQIAGYASAAAASATASANSATAASGSASSATASASAASTSAGNAATSATNASNSATSAANSATSAASIAAGVLATSTTSVVIGTGSKTFITQSGKQFANGQFISVVSAGNNANYMHGQVTSYSGTTLIINALDIGGSGTHADWNISISGTQGPAGSGSSVNLNAFSVLANSTNASALGTSLSFPAYTVLLCTNATSPGDLQAGKINASYLDFTGSNVGFVYSDGASLQGYYNASPSLVGFGNSGPDTINVVDPSIIIGTSGISYIKSYPLVSATDDDSSYLEDKIVAGSGVTITKLNPGGSEQLSIAATGGGAYRGAVVYQATNQSIPALTYTAISFDAERIDTDGIHSNSVNNSRMTVPTGVTKIRFFGQTGLQPGAGSPELVLYKNGSIFTGPPVPRTNMQGSGGDVYTQFVSSVITTTAGDYWEFVVKCGAANTYINQTWFEMQIIG